MSNVEVVQMDALDALRGFKEDTFHAAVVDFPWEFDTNNGTDRFGHDQSTGDSDLYAHIGPDEMEETLFHLEYLIKPGGWIFLFADDEKYPTFREMVENAGWHDDEITRRQTVYWDSDSMGMGYYHRVQAYPIIAATVGKTERYIQGRPNIYRAKHHSPSAEYHTMKPVELYRQLLAPPVVEEGERVLEPFAGTFPSAVVAQERGFDALGYEVLDEPLEIARSRIAQQTLFSADGGCISRARDTDIDHGGGTDGA